MQTKHSLIVYFHSLPATLRWTFFTNTPVKPVDSISNVTDKWAVTWQNQQNGCALGEDSDQPWHPPSLIRVFAVRMKKAWVLSYLLSAQQLWSDWANAQADLSLRWAHRSYCWFCHAVVKMIELIARCNVLLTSRHGNGCLTSGQHVH